MKREDKFKDTATFHYYNANPKNRITGDCAFRAISTALEQDYNQTVMEMAETMCKTGYALNDAKGEEKYTRSRGRPTEVSSRVRSSARAWRFRESGTLPTLEATTSSQ